MTAPMLLSARAPARGRGPSSASPRPRPQPSPAPPLASARGRARRACVRLACRRPSCPRERRAAAAAFRTRPPGTRGRRAMRRGRTACPAGTQAAAAKRKLAMPPGTAAASARTISAAVRHVLGRSRWSGVATITLKLVARVSVATRTAHVASCGSARSSINTGPRLTTAATCRDQRVECNDGRSCRIAGFRGHRRDQRWQGDADRLHLVTGGYTAVAGAPQRVESRPDG